MLTFQHNKKVLNNIYVTQQIVPNEKLIYAIQMTKIGQYAL